jgi:hypothetical protein
VLVVLVAAVCFSAWNLTMRPYPTDGSCGAPLTVLAVPVHVPKADREVREYVDRVALEESVSRDRDAWKEIPSNRNREYPWDAQIDAHAPRFTERERVTVNSYEIQRAEIRQAERDECLAHLSTAGFWVRGLAPVGALAAVAAAGWFIAKGDAGHE